MDKCLIHFLLLERGAARMHTFTFQASDNHYISEGIFE